MSVIKRNLSWILFAQAATWGVSIVLLIVAPRRLGGEELGRLFFAAAYVALFEIVALFGTATYLQKVIARDPSSLGRYVFNSLVLKLAITATLVAVAVGLAIVVGYPRETVQLIAVCCISMVFNTLNSCLAGGLFGWQQMARPALWDTVRSYAAGALGVAVLMHGGSALQYALVSNLVCGVPFVANLIYLWPALKANRTIRPDLWKEVLRGGFPFFILAALLVLYGTIDVPLLEAFTGSETVGWYLLAYRWVSLPAFFAASVASAFFPALSAEPGELSANFRRMANQALHLVVLVATPGAVGIALIAGKFIHLLYGAEFHQSVPLMQILALHIPIVGVDIVLGSVIAAADRQRQWVYVSVAAAVLNPMLNMAAIPATDHLFSNGAIGAAVITALTEVLLLVGALRLRPAGVLDRATTRTLLRVVAASLTMVPVVLVLSPAPVGVQVVAGMVTYGLASLALGTVSFGEVRSWISGLRSRRSQQPVIP